MTQNFLWLITLNSHHPFFLDLIWYILFLISKMKRLTDVLQIILFLSTLFFQMVKNQLIMVKTSNQLNYSELTKLIEISSPSTFLMQEKIVNQNFLILSRWILFRNMWKWEVLETQRRLLPQRPDSSSPWSVFLKLLQRWDFQIMSKRETSKKLFVWLSTLFSNQPLTQQQVKLIWT